MIEQRDFQYLILPGNPDGAAIDIHNQVFELWKSVWKDVFNSLHFTNFALANDFYRQKYISVILYQNQVTAVHLYSRFSLKSLVAQEHSYFTSNYPAEFFTKLDELQISEVLSMEYLTVSPKFSEKKLGISIADIVIGLGVKLFESTGTDALIAPARNDYKISHKGYKLGFNCVMPNIMNHNVSCDLIAGIRGRLRDHEKPEINAYVNYLWNARTNYTTNENLNRTESVLKLVA